MAAGCAAMADLFWLNRAQAKRIAPLPPLTHGVRRVYDQRVVSSTLHLIRDGLCWSDPPAEYGLHEPLYNRPVRWDRLGVFNRPLAGPAGRAGEPARPMIDAIHFKARRTAANLLKKDPFPAIGRTRRV